MSRLALFTLAGIVLGSSAAYAQEQVPDRTDEDDKGIFSAILENDVFDGTDKGYTNGTRFSWLSSEKSTPDWLKSAANELPLIDPDGKKRISVALGQSIYTPDNVLTKVPDPNDRPYAGWLYGSVGVVSDTGNVFDNVVLTLGVVGPWSYAEQTQKTVHHIIGDDQPQGWNYQLKNEPGVMLTYERKWRDFYQGSYGGIATDIMPEVSANAGNVNTSAGVGATWRIGFDLPADYGPPRIRPSLPGSDFFIPSDQLSGYLFTTVEGRGVAHDIFLDGNTFADSPSVDKELLVGSLQIGAAMTYEDLRLSYTQVYMTKQYTTEAKPDAFGVLTLSYRF